MTVLKRTYFLAPTRDSPPDGPIALGNLITDPRSPESPLNNPASEATLRLLEDSPPYDSEECDVLRQVGSSVRVKPSVWSTFLAGAIGPSLGMTRDKENNAAYAISRLSTRRIHPDMKTVQALFQEDDVQMAIRDSRFRANLYLIDGIQIAHGVEYKLGETRELGVDLGLSADLTAAGAPGVTAGVGVEARKASTAGSSGRISSDFVFAYSLREITYRRKRVERQTRMSGGDLMSTDERRLREHARPGTTEDGVDGQAEFLCLKEDNPDLPQYWDCESRDVVGLDGAICQAVLVGDADEEDTD